MSLSSSVIRLYGPGDVRVDDEELDVERLEVHQIAAKTLFTAISPGTELAAYRGDPPLRPTAAPYPRLVGYCNVAEVVAVGDDVVRVRRGDLVLTGQSHRSAFICDQDAVYQILPPGLDPARASTAYLFHLGYTSLLAVNMTQGQSVAVIGLGPLGLGTVACAHMMGLKVSAVSDRPASCELAQKWGARVVCKNDAPSITDVDCVVLTSALWKDWLLSLKTVRVGGVIAVLGFPGRGQGLPDFNPLDSQWLYDKRLTIKATGPPESAEDLRRNLGYLLHCMAVGQLDSTPLISKIIDWRELPHLYAMMVSNRGAMLSAVLKW